MRCHYEVLGVERQASPDAIKKAYRKNAVLYHPDKAASRGEDVAKAKTLFQELQAAYECLSDADERAFYDAHRTQILRGDDDTNFCKEGSSQRKKNSGRRSKERKKSYDAPGTQDDRVHYDAYGVHVWPYFSRQAFAEFNDDRGQPGETVSNSVALYEVCVDIIGITVLFFAFILSVLGMRSISKNVEQFAKKAMPPPRTPERKPGFYGLYDNVFAQIDACERMAASANSIEYRPAPRFGNSTLDHDYVKKFYLYFDNFVSSRSFREAEPPELRKLLLVLSTAKYNGNRRKIEQQLSRYRAEARREYELSIRKLSAHCKRRDPRVAAIRALEDQRKAQELAAQQKAKNEKRNKFLEARAAWQGSSKVNETENVATSEYDDLVFECSICSKTFRTEHAFDCHLNTKIHQRRADAAAGKDDTTTKENPTVPVETTGEPVDCYCALCNKRFTSGLGLERHLQSRVHRNALKTAKVRVRKAQ